MDTTVGTRKKPISFWRGILKPYAIVFRHVFTKPHTIKYPYERLKFSEGFRGRLFLDVDRCIGCGLCARTCPNNAIGMTPVRGYDHNFPQIDFGKCSFCDFCLEICPRGALKTSGIVELSATKKENLVYSPQKLAELPSLNEILSDLRKIISIKIADHKISYIVESEVKK